jgi:predicted transcriptional regulator
MTITIDLPPEQYERLAELARREGLTAEEFARRELAGMLTRDAAFQAAAGYVLEKNAELYRRLAK